VSLSIVGKAAAVDASKAPLRMVNFMLGKRLGDKDVTEVLLDLDSHVQGESGQFLYSANCPAWNPRSSHDTAQNYVTRSTACKWQVRNNAFYKRAGALLCQESGNEPFISLVHRSSVYYQLH
jgi:hypothetical protein